MFGDSAHECDWITMEVCPVKDMMPLTQLKLEWLGLTHKVFQGVKMSILFFFDTDGSLIGLIHLLNTHIQM